MKTRWSQRIYPLLPHLLLMAAAFLLYAQSFGHQWTMDDQLVVARNTDIRSLKEFLEDSYPGRPLREVTYLLDYQLFGANPAGYHLQNIFWHGLSASLVVVLGSTLGASPLVAWLAGILFLVHPLNVEVVANISHRKESLMLTFSLLALLSLHRFYHKERRWLWGAIGVTALGVASLAKQAAVGVVPVILGYESNAADMSRRILFRRPWVVRVFMLSAAMAAIGWILLVWPSEAFQSSMSESLVHMNVYKNWTSQLYLLFILKAVTFMFARLLWPTDLAMEYLFPAPDGWFDPWVLAGLGILALLVWLIWRLRREPLPFVGVLLMLGFWLPVSNLFWPLSYFAADRYMYGVCAGFALLISWLAGQLFERRRTLHLAASGTVLACFAVLAWHQDKVWANELTLYTQAIAVSPASTTAMMGVGMAHLNAGNLDEARRHLEKAALNFNDSKALYLLAMVHEGQGDRQGAISHYLRFIQMNEPRYYREVASARRKLLLLYATGK